MKKTQTLYTITGFLIFKAVYNNSDLIGFLYLACLIFLLVVISKLIRLTKCILKGKGNELNFSDISTLQTGPALIILQNNKVVNYDKDFYDIDFDF